MATVLDANEMFYTTFQPKVKNSYVLLVDNIPSFLINAVDPPKFQDQSIKIDHINSYFKIRGKREWQDVQITLYDPITPSGAQACMDWARLGYESVTGRAGYQDWYKKDVTLQILGPVGDVVSEWVYVGAWIRDFTPDKLEWSNNGDTANISCTLVYDYAVLSY